MIDMELGTRVDWDLELMLEGETGCEWPGHENVGKPGNQHGNEGGLWKIFLRCGCGDYDDEVVTCDKAHSRLMQMIQNRERYKLVACNYCNREMTIAEAYVKSVKFG